MFGTQFQAQSRGGGSHLCEARRDQRPSFTPQHHAKQNSPPGSLCFALPRHLKRQLQIRRQINPPGFIFHDILSVSSKFAVSVSHRLTDRYRGSPCRCRCCWNRWKSCPLPCPQWWSWCPAWCQIQHSWSGYGWSASKPRSPRPTWHPAP